MKNITSLLTALIMLKIALFSTPAFAQQSDLKTSPVKRNITSAELSRFIQSYHPTVKTKGNSPNVINGIARVIDGTDVRVFPSANPQSEVHISIDENNPNNLVASCNTFAGNYNLGYYFTLDGGVTWNGADRLQNSPALLSGDPSTAFNSRSRAHIASIDGAGGGYVTQSSINGGANWSLLSQGVV